MDTLDILEQRSVVNFGRLVTDLFQGQEITDAMLEEDEKALKRIMDITIEPTSSQHGILMDRTPLLILEVSPQDFCQAATFSTLYNGIEISQNKIHHVINKLEQLDNKMMRIQDQMQKFFQDYQIPQDEEVQKDSGMLN